MSNQDHTVENMLANAAATLAGLRSIPQQDRYPKWTKDIAALESIIRHLQDALRHGNVPAAPAQLHLNWPSGGRQRKP
jgi:uncharacterized protein YukE